MEDNNLMAAAQLVFAEKRTALALLRTGISVIALPLAVTSALIATSRLYDTGDILHLIIPVMTINISLVVFGVYLVVRSVKKLRHEDRMINSLKQSHPDLAPYFD